MKYVMFCSPRTGSNCVCEILSEYFKKYHGYKNYLLEYLNTRSSLFPNTFYHYTDKIEQCNEPIENTVQSRFNLLKQHNNEDYFLKLFSVDFNIVDIHLKNEIFNYFNDNYTFICLEREYKLDQFLSFRLAMYNNRWKSEDPEQIPEEEFVITAQHVINFSRHVYAYEQLLPKIKNKICIRYEDFADEPNKILELVGLEEKPVTTLVKHEKINVKNPMNFVKNKEEVLAWIKPFGYKSKFKNVDKTF